MKLRAARSSRRCSLLANSKNCFGSAADRGSEPRLGKRKPANLNAVFGAQQREASGANCGSGFSERRTAAAWTGCLAGLCRDGRCSAWGEAPCRRSRWDRSHMRKLQRLHPRNWDTFLKRLGANWKWRMSCSNSTVSTLAITGQQRRKNTPCGFNVVLRIFIFVFVCACVYFKSKQPPLLMVYNLCSLRLQSR